MNEATLRLMVGIAVEAVRESSPIVRCLCPAAKAGFVGEALTAIGVVPSLTDSAWPPLEGTSAIAIADTHLPNDEARTLAGWAREHSVPWVLHVSGDPTASDLVELGPTAVLGAPASSVSLVPGEPTVVRTAGAELRLGLPNPDLTRVFGAEDLITALAAACATVTGPVEAVVAASTWVALAAERAAEHARGTGSLRVDLIDELTLLGGDEVAERVVPG